MFKLIKKYPALLSFGILTAAFSSPGQTFLISLFIPSMQTDFGLSKTEISSIYSMATLVSAFILPITGKILDRMHLPSISTAAGMLLALGCFLLSKSTDLTMIFLGFLLIRNLGQGTLTMISSTTMARIFGPARGKALGIANLGYPLGEALFPVTISAWILANGWRSGWMFLSGIVACFFIPAVLVLLRSSPHHKAQEDIAKAAEKTIQKGTQLKMSDWTVRKMFGDWRFYLILFPVLVPPTFFTGLFFHQISIFEMKGWGLQVISAGFVAYGFFRATVSFLVGPWIDKLSAKKVYPLNLVPLGLGIICLGYGSGSSWALLYLGFSGMTMGLSMTISSALFAELYGTRALGSIKGIISALVVFSTAVAPVVMGALLDANVAVSTIVIGMLVTILFATISSYTVCSSKVE